MWGNADKVARVSQEGVMSNSNPAKFWQYAEEAMFVASLSKSDSKISRWEIFKIVLLALVISLGLTSMIGFMAIAMAH
jgi:hypothetical protein